MLAAFLPLAALSACWGAGPGFYSHYWVRGQVQADGQAATARQINFYLQDQQKKATGLTNAQGLYLLNACDLPYFYGLPLTLETVAYTVTPVLQSSETANAPAHPLLPAAQGYVDQPFSIVSAGAAPRLVSGEPTGDGAPLMPNIMLVFSKSMDSNSVIRATQLTKGGTQITTAWWFDPNDTSTYIFHPNDYLDPTTPYIVHIAATAHDDQQGLFLNQDAANPFGVPVKFSFTTGNSRVANTGPPKVNRFIPRDGETEVPRMTSIVVAFNKEMDPDSVVAATDLPAEGKPYTVRWNDGAPSIVTFTCHGLLGGEKYYTVKVGPGARDSAGIHMLQSYQATWRTTLTYSGPSVVGILSGTGIPVTTAIWATFSTAIEPSSLPANFEVRDSAGNLVPGQFRWDGDTNTVTYTPYSRLKSLEYFSIKIKTGLTDPWGFHLKKEVNSLFQTEDVSGPAIKKVWFDGRGYVENDIISPTAQITAEISDPSGLDYGALSLRVGSVLLVGRNNFKTQDVYSNNRLVYKVSPALPEGNYIMTIEAFDVLGNSSDWQGKVRVFSGETQIVPGTVPFASPASISPLKAAGAGGTSQVSMVYQLTTPGNIDLQIAGIGGVIWARRYLSGTMGGFAGYNAVEWDGKDNAGTAPANGVYTFRIINNGRLLGKGYIIVYD